jgi:demethylmenaquinone methyltransferase/2-methoxy-6-polyprenyl-1,4-benzoquinol methylase
MYNKTRPQIKNMFNSIAHKYDVMNDVISLGLHRRVKTAALGQLNIPAGAKILDLCCGTGDLARIVKKIQPQAEVTGVDFSAQMLEIARTQCANITLLQDDVNQLRFDNGSFDIVTMGFGLRNVEDKEKALAQIHRLLKPGGQFLHLDFGEKNFISSLFDFCVQLFLPQPYDYLISSKQAFPPPEQLIKTIEAAGFKFKTRKDYVLGVISSQLFIS